MRKFTIHTTNKSINYYNNLLQFIFLLKGFLFLMVLSLAEVTDYNRNGKFNTGPFKAAPIKNTNVIVLRFDT